VKKDAEILSNMPLFKGLPRTQMEDLTRIVANKHFRKGQTVFSEGDKGTGFYVVIDGLVRIFKLSVEGKEQILHIFGPGEPFGEVPVFAGRNFPAHAEAIAESRLFFFPRDAFTALISENPSLALNMLALLSMRLRQFTVQVEQLSLKEVPGRLAAYLQYLSDEKGGGTSFDLDISKGHLASLLGTIPETLSRIFARMTQQGLIRVDGRRISITDQAGLEALATGGKALA
jgi:CRP/FNR family transcriptional regulator, dissimilatory nitrate respiration regulator